MKKDIKKIIFLDLDGVLNIYAGKFPTYKMKLEHFETELIENLNILLSLDKEIMLVMTSSWRSDYSDAINLLKNLGFKYEKRFIGATDILEVDRGLEIISWIDNNSYNGAYICVDDIIETISNHINVKYCLKTDPKKGLTKENANYIYNYFNKY